MTKKSPARNAKGIQRNPASSGCNLLLALTLVPVVVGALLIGGWVLDISILDDAQSQITVGILFILLGFAASNSLQKRWRLASGWGLLMCADLVLLVWLNLWAQVIAIGFGLMGLVFLGIEFYMQYRQGKLKKEHK